MKTKLKGILTLLLAFVVQLTFAQEKTISGTVSDDSGPLPGVSILIKGTPKGTETDFDGNYSIKAKVGSILVFQYLGYKKEERTIGQSNTINLTLVEDSSSLEEVVVVAYGTQSRASLTGSVSVIDSEQIENQTFSNPVKSLEGLVSGLRVTQASGQPGSDPIIRIRGFASINANAAPLIVLDGVPYTGSLNSINPQDIESTTVLKDASSTSLYGNKAANGVLLITTKKGSKNSTVVNIDTRFGVTQRATKEYDVIRSPAKFYETYHSVLANSRFNSQRAAGTPITFAEASQFASNNLIDRVGYNIYDVADNVLVDPTTGRLNSSANLLNNDSWEDVLFRDNATFNSLNASVSGGSEDGSNYYLSVGSEENNGYTVRSHFKRQTARLRVNSKKLANFIQFSGNMAYAKTNTQAVPATLNAAGNPTNSFANAFFWTRRIAPIYPVFQYDQNWDPILDPTNPSGRAYDFGATQTFSDGSTRGPRQYAPNEHPLAVLENSTETTERDYFTVGFRTKVDLPLDIKFEQVINYLTETDRTVDYTAPGAGAFAAAENGLLTNGFSSFTNLTSQQLLTWEKDSGDNSFYVLLGHENFVQEFTPLNLTKYNLVGSFSPILDNASKYVGDQNYNEKYATQGFFSKFTYGYKNSYYLNLTARRDASSVFHPDNRWGTFWSAGASWTISNETFMEEISDVVNYAKFAVNYGTTGNDGIFYPDTTERNFVAYEDQSEVSENNGELKVDPKYRGNRDLTWEKAGSFDVSLEMRLFEKINLNLGYYTKTTRDLLFNTPQPGSVGGGLPIPENAGTMVNSGFETEIAADILRKENFRINVNANLSTIKNELTELPYDGGEIITFGNFRRVEGNSIFEYFMRRFAGVNPDNGNSQWYMIDETTGEDVITEDYGEADRYDLGKEAIPDAFGGFGTNIDIGNFNIALQFAYQIGGYGVDNQYYAMFDINTQVSNFAEYEKTWTVNNPTASLPRVDPSSPNQYSPSDLYLIDASYLSLNTINAGYTLSNDKLRKLHIESLRLYGIVNNGFLLYTARQGYDPRLSLTGGSFNEFGANRTISFGLNLKIK